jgi:hypothetical protein
MNKPREQNATNTSENTTVNNPNIGPYKSGTVFIKPDSMPKPRSENQDEIKGKKSCC